MLSAHSVDSNESDSCSQYKKEEKTQSAFLFGRSSRLFSSAFRLYIGYNFFILRFCRYICFNSCLFFCVSNALNFIGHCHRGSIIFCLLLTGLLNRQFLFHSIAADRSLDCASRFLSALLFFYLENRCYLSCIISIFTGHLLFNFTDIKFFGNRSLCRVLIYNGY